MWKVVPLCSAQLRDVRPEDILYGGDFRLCDTYRGGGGYDQFPQICKKRLGRRLHKQLVVQLYGCNLACPYCYVTQAGIWGAYKEYSSEQLVEAFLASGAEVFHLMGGAPAIHLNSWPELLDVLDKQTPPPVFHSDFLLTERRYEPKVLTSIARPNVLCVISVKGTTKQEYVTNTGRTLDWTLFWDNFGALLDSGIQFYLTFTACSPEGVSMLRSEIMARFGRQAVHVLEDSFEIALISYKALDEET